MATKETKLAIQQTVSTIELKFGDFKPIVGTTGSTLHVLETNANHSRSMDLLDKAGLRPLEYQEILPLLMKDETLKNSLKGKWFYLAGRGLNEDGIYTIDDKGELAKIDVKELPIENKVRVWSGKNQLSFLVNSDYNTASYGGRFGLDAYAGPHVVAPIVVGKPKLSLSEQADALLRK